MLLAREDDRRKAQTLCRLGIPADGIDDISSLRPPTLRLLVVSTSLIQQTDFLC